MDAAIYVRISLDQRGDGLGVARQEQDCRELVDRRGWTVHEVYSDNDLSAYSGKRRPAYQRMLADVRSGAVQAVVAWHPDRLQRSPRDLEAFIDLVEKTKCKVETCQAGVVDLATPTGRAVARTVGAWARHESEHKAERERSAFQQMRLDGRRHGGGRMYGYRRRTSLEIETKGGKGLEIVPEEAEVIREAAARVLAGESLYGIANDLTARGVPTARGGLWKDATLRALLTAAVISGRVEHRYAADGKRLHSRHLGRIIGPGKWEPIISVELSDRLRAVLAHPQNTKGRNPEHLLTGGIAVCGRCGSNLYSHYTQRKRHLICLKPAWGGPATGCGRLAIKAEPVEEIVSETVLAAVDAGALNALLREPDRPALDELAAVEAQLAELRREWAAGAIGRGELDAGRAVLVTRQQELTRRLDASRRVLGLDGLPDPLRPAWPGLTLPQQRAVIKALAEVVIQPATKPFNKFNPDRISIRWRDRPLTTTQAAE